MAELQFNAQNYTPAVPGVSQLPVSDDMGHPVVITSSEFVATKNDDTQAFLKVGLQITEGSHAGASGVHRLNIYNKSEAAANIAMAELSAICHVTGIYQITDTVQLHNIPFRILVRQQKNDDQYTEVYGFLDIAGNLPGQTAPQAPQAQPTPPLVPAPQAQPTPPAAPAAGGQPWKTPGTVGNVPVPGNPPAQPQAGGGQAPPWGPQG